MNAKRWILASGLLLLGIGLLLYGPSIRYEFVELDDPLLILENPAAQSLTWKNIATVFSTYDPELYIPLTFVSYQIDAAIGGLEPFVFHLHNLLHHVLNAWLFLMLAFLLTKNRMVGLLAGLLFLVHPIHTEAVMWVSGRKDLLSTTFFLGSLLLYILYKREKTIDTYLKSLGAFLLGLLSKVTVVSLPLVLCIIDAIEGRKITTKSLIEKIPYVVLSMIFGIVALFGKSGAPSLSLGTRVLVAIKSLVFSVGKIIVPVGLSPMYSHTGPISILEPAFFVPVLLTVTAITVMIVLRKRLKALIWGSIFVVVTFLPSFGNLVKNGEYYLTSDRYAYIPSLAIILLVAIGLHRLPTMIVKIAGGALVVVLAVTTALHGRVWANTRTLSAYIVQVSPEARLGHMWHGNALRDEGRLEEALAEYGTALSMKDDRQVYYNRGLAYEALEKIPEAIADYQQAIAMDRLYALPRINLGRLLYLQGKKDEARIQFESAATAAPHLAMPLYNLGVLAGEREAWEQAADYYRKALVRDPLLTDARANLVIALLSLDRIDEAVEELQRVLNDDAENPTANATLQKLIDDGIVEDL